VGGMGSLSALTPAQLDLIAAALATTAPPPPPPPPDGAALYAQNCAGCHGNAKKGRPAAAIQRAIDKNTGGMGSLSALTPAQIAAISAAR
jgi:mono/diheme cytochrome c family protein